MPMPEMVDAGIEKMKRSTDITRVFKILLVTKVSFSMVLILSVSKTK
jgi:hypothetical protein